MNVPESMAKAWDAYSLAIDEIAKKAFLENVKPMLEEHRLCLITGNGSWVIYSGILFVDMGYVYNDRIVVFREGGSSGSVEYMYEATPDWLDMYDVLIQEVDGRYNDLGSLMPSYDSMTGRYI